MTWIQNVVANHIHLDLFSTFLHFIIFLLRLNIIWESHSDFYIEIVIIFSISIALQYKAKSRITLNHDILGKYDVTQTFMRVMWQNTAGQGNIIPTIRDKIFWSIPCKTDIHDDQGLRQIQRKMFSKQSFISSKQTLVFSFDWYFELLMNFSIKDAFVIREKCSNWFFKKPFIFSWNNVLRSMA